MKPEISIIMPAYNEGEHIYNNISMTLDVMREVGRPAEIVAVDDGSEDNTLAEIERAAHDFDNTAAARNPYNMGKGMALRTGFDYSRGDIVVFLDADLDLHPSQIKNLISILEEGPYDAVVTSKHHPESRLDYPWFRKVASWVYYMLIKLLFGLPVRDTQTGLKVFRREVLSNVFHRLLVKKFAYDVELLATAVRFGFRVHEVPAVLEFKRGLNWGRISPGDIISIFVDTCAIFYRLRILRYYDAERPPMPLEDKPVLVVVRGCPPPDDVIRRLSVDTNTGIACIAENTSGEDEGIMYFPDDGHFDSWMQSNRGAFEYIGFLGAGCLPVGSWVKNAVRNFDDPDVIAVCGPVVPGQFSTVWEKAANFLFSSFYTVGPENYLTTLKPLKSVRKGLLDNVFLRTDYWCDEQKEKRGISIGKGCIYDVSPKNWRLRYDPDVTVSKQVPPLFVPYLSMAARDSFSKGCLLFTSKREVHRWWWTVPSIIWLVLLAGRVVLPTRGYMVFAVLYLLVVIAAGLSCFDLVTAPVLMLGILLEHLIRAFAFSAGVIAGLFKKRTKLDYP